MNLNIFDNLFLLQRLDHLIRTRATGTPAQLAKRLGCCERDIYRMMAQLREQGFPIGYDKQVGAYFYDDSVKLDITILVGTEKLLSIRGGEKNFDFFSQLPDFGSDRPDFCTVSTLFQFARGKNKETGTI